jgi:hypothetical protein
MTPGCDHNLLDVISDSDNSCYLPAAVTWLSVLCLSPAQVLDSEQTMEVAGLAALALGLVFTSSCKEDVVEAILTALMSR